MMELIRIIDNILHDAKTNRKELWLLLLDMSKAFDRVNIEMLKQAMFRLKLPATFVNFVTNIFSHRYNKVFTAHGLTHSFLSLTSIDQGEVVSPLL